MFGLTKRTTKPMGRPPKKYGERATYKQVAVTPQAHAKISAMAAKQGDSIIDTVSKLVGV